MSTDPVAFIQKQIEVIDEERGILERTLGHLSPSASASSFGWSSGAGGSPRPRRQGRRAPRGFRQQQLLDAIKKNPQATPGELGKTIGVSSSNAHAMVRRLEDAGRLRRDKAGFAITAR